MLFVIPSFGETPIYAEDEDIDTIIECEDGRDYVVKSRNGKKIWECYGDCWKAVDTNTCDKLQFDYMQLFVIPELTTTAPLVMKKKVVRKI